MKLGIVGLPNVGKSTLFNRLVGERKAIVDATAGTTRDRHYGKTDWNGKEFSIIDTGGYTVNSEDIFEDEIRRQVLLAIDEADVILFLVEVRTGITDLDMLMADILRRTSKKVILVCNKVDNNDQIYSSHEFYALGLGDPYCISSMSGSGTGDLMDAILDALPVETASEEDEDLPHITIVGRPNVGKSSLVNRLVGSERTMVSDIAGTTRDAIDTLFTVNGTQYNIIDTAGIRRKRAVEDETLERYSVLRSLAAVERSRVCVIMIDATVGFTEQDSKVAGYAHDQGKACIIAVNKWDAVEKDSYTMDKMRKQLEEDFSFMSYAPILFISAKTGQRLDKLFETIQYVDVQNGTRIPTGALNEMLARSTARVQPPSDKGKRLKIFYITQSSTRPPTFVAFVNQKALFHFSYQRYIENQIRENFGLTGTPMRLLIREHGDGSAR